HRRVDRPEPARAEPLAEPVAAEHERCARDRLELVRGRHQGSVRRRNAVPSERPVMLTVPYLGTDRTAARGRRRRSVLLRRGRRAPPDNSTPAAPSAPATWEPGRRRGRRLTNPLYPPR